MNDYSEVYNIIPIIFEEKLHKETLFHYTNIAGFLLMMENIRDKKCYIFPGHMKFQNDKQELIEGISFIKENIYDIPNNEIYQKVTNSLDELNNNIYITCFSSNGDLLEQWKYYGNNCGLSIEFDFNQCEGFFDDGKIEKESRNVFLYEAKEACFEKNDINKKIGFDFEEEFWDVNKTLHTTTRGGISLYPINVLYTNKEKIEIVNQALNENINENMATLNLYNSSINKNEYIDCAVSTIVPICKNCNFEHEKESRLIFFPLKEAKIKYREKNNRILPYLKCTVVNKDANKYPIISVTVGPGNNQNLVFNAVISMLEGHDNAKFISEEDCEAIKRNKSKYSDLSELKAKICPGELSYYKNEKEENVIVYCSINGILVYKSAIPFRD